MSGRALSIYLGDHFAGATAGVELARRVRSSNRGEPEFGEPLARICAEIEADRETLGRLIGRTGSRPGRVKPAGAWVMEKLGRLKLNGQLRGYAPLSRLVELEGLAIGIAGKAALWRSLEQALGREWEGLDFGELGARAERQRVEVEALRLRAAAIAFAQA